MEIFFFWILLAVGVGALAASRGRSGFGYFLLSVIVSPLIGLIVVLVSEDKTKRAEQDAATERDHQRRLEEVRALSAAQAPRAPEGAPAAAAGPVILVADELAKLAELRDKGVLTQAEFDAQKALVLGARNTATAAPAVAAQPAQPPMVEMGKCSCCSEPLPIRAMECPKCKAIFSEDSAYRVLAK